MLRKVYRRFLIMAISKFTAFGFTAFVFFSFMFTKFQNSISVDEGKHHLPRNSSDSSNAFGRNFDDSGPFPANKLGSVFVFLQISDLHISIFSDPNRAPDFQKFCTEVVSAIKPKVVLASGDLTDGITADFFGSRQFLEEWKLYQKALYESNVQEKTLWLDIRGNHDNFNIPDINSKFNYFREYSVQGKKNLHSYSVTVNHEREKYTFIAIDACLHPGVKRPFNFLGLLNREEYGKLEKFKKEAENSNFTIWFGHYPTSTMVSPDPGPRELMRNSGPYLCGHLHTLVGLVPEMYTLHPTGSLELELGDWKTNRKFRVAAIDHGIFSFVDVKLNRWPIILVTNPKNALFAMPQIEPLYRIRRSTHIRVLVYSLHPLLTVRFSIDGGEWRAMNYSAGALYTAPWNPLQYTEGSHALEVYAKDAMGNEQKIMQDFSLDGSRPLFPVLARMALMGHVSVGQWIFSFTLIFILLPLCILRCLYLLKKDRDIRRKSENNCCRRLLFKFYLLTSVNRLFWPLIMLGLYVGVGPWFIGEIIDGNIGACFVWGIFVAGTLLPGGLTFFVGTIYLVTFYLPLVCLLSSYLYRHYCHLHQGGAPSCSFKIYVWRHFAMIVLMLWQTCCVIGYFLSYGYLSCILGILNTYSLVLALVLWRFSVTLPEALFPGRGGENIGHSLDGDWEKRQRESKQTLLRASCERMDSHVMQDNIATVAADTHL